MGKPRPTGWVIYSGRDGVVRYRDSGLNYQEDCELAQQFATQGAAKLGRHGDALSTGIEPIERARERLGEVVSAPDRCYWDPNHIDGKFNWDHVPPQGVFLDRHRKFVPMVRSCMPCNEEWSKESEYFREFLLRALPKGAKHPDIPELLELERRARRYREQAGKKKGLFDEANTDRVAPVLVRMVRCMESRHQIAPVPWQTYKYSVSLLHGDGLKQGKWEIAKHGQEIAAGRCRYVYIGNQHNMNQRSIVVAFYDDVVFEVVTSETAAIPFSRMWNAPMGSVLKGYEHALPPFDEGAV